MSRLYSCDKCHTTLEPEEVYQIRIPKRKIADVCHDCLILVKRKKYPMPYIKTKRVYLYRVFSKHMRSRKTETFYTLLKTQLEELESMFSTDKSDLHDRDGNHIWSVYEVRSCMENDDKFLFERLHDLISFQTLDERDAYETKYANNVGCNKPDSKFLTAMDKLLAEGKELTPKQIESVRARMSKYVRQLTTYINIKHKQEKPNV